MNNQNFGASIKNIRNKKNMSLRQVEIASGGLSSSFISKLENGKRNIPKPETLEKLAKGLRIPKEEIFKLAGLETSKPNNVEYIMTDINKTSLGTYIKNTLDKNGWSLRQAALQIGVSPAYLSKLTNKKADSNPKLETLNKIAKGLRINKFILYNLAGIETPKPSNIEYIDSNFVNVPVIGEIACDEPITSEENISDYVPIPADVVKNGTFFILNCVGNSMEPTITNGSQVVIREQSDAENDQIAAVLLEDENTATLKRIKKTKTSVILLPDNPEYEPIILNKDKRGRILGIIKMEMKRF